MSKLTFIVNGQEVDADTLKKTAPKARVRPKVDADQKFHKGWRVMGHKPGALEAAQKAREEDLARWARMSDKSRSEARSRGEKDPKPWDEVEWRRNSRLQAVRSKPYMVPEAADECAEIARKSGWIDVVVVELKKGDANDSPTAY